LEKQKEEERLKEIELQREKKLEKLRDKEREKERKREEQERGTEERKIPRRQTREKQSAIKDEKKNKEGEGENSSSDEEPPTPSYSPPPPPTKHKVLPSVLRRNRTEPEEISKMQKRLSNKEVSKNIQTNTSTTSPTSPIIPPKPESDRSKRASAIVKLPSKLTPDKKSITDFLKPRVKSKTVKEPDVPIADEEIEPEFHAPLPSHSKKKALPVGLTSNKSKINKSPENPGTSPEETSSENPTPLQKSTDAIKRSRSDLESKENKRLKSNSKPEITRPGRSSVRIKPTEPSPPKTPERKRNSTKLPVRDTFFHKPRSESSLGGKNPKVSRETLTQSPSSGDKLNDQGSKKIKVRKSPEKKHCRIRIIRMKRYYLGYLTNRL